MDIDDLKMKSLQAKNICDSLSDFDDKDLAISKSYLASQVTSVYGQEQREALDPVRIDEVESLFGKRTFGMLTVPYHRTPALGTERLRYSKIGSDIIVMPNTESWDLSHREPPLHTFREEGIKFTPAMTVMKYHDGRPELTHTGTGCLFDLLRKEHDPDVDCYVITFGDVQTTDDGNARIVEAHRRSGAPVTAYVVWTDDPDDTRPTLVRTVEGGPALHDPRDLIDPPTGPRLVEYGVYVVSTSLLQSPPGAFHWDWKRRRYHEHNRVWLQVERDMCQLTQLFVTNYLRP